MTTVMGAQLPSRPPPTRDRPLRVAVGDSHRRSFTVAPERCIANLVAGPTCALLNAWTPIN